MFDDYQICPYTGLRSFTEEESLYFKGREEHIEHATEQLQRNKFLMLTGASGDGKSSLVYAGIVPNARAGFLKSKYTQWCVADFRPERSPFRNLCSAIAMQLEISNPSIVESELQHGFSALADLYRNSKRYVDVDSVEWNAADEAGKAALKRTAANLIVIVDQFEEFFTNPENYRHGVPSKDSNLVLNILLETARIALEENLPIYIVFTMRSDYIGQCAAFRSLPEYIGFSQFFVPRLNRSQLQQVIEEPAELSGNRITRRLTERLIHDIAEGVDQLPILQHALNQIWHAADQGKEEMDLIHYAMVGGLAVTELPDEDAGRFNAWFAKLPEKIEQCYHQPNLQNVLDTHANKLYESAGESYRIKTGKAVTNEDAKAIIKTVFTCLTKIDQSRAVRNRMTLLEISNILGKEDIGTKDVAAVLNIFREPGNTFIRPFITDDPDSNSLHDSGILDITHESLIRNWRYLETWAKEEFDNYSISLDFEKQLSRWVDSDKSNGFLLSIGPLTYFESWYNKVNPNAWWIARYLPEETDQEKKLETGKVVLGNALEFIRRSAAKHVVTRTIMQYGPKRIAVLIAVIGLLVFSAFAVNSYLQHKNAAILKAVKEKTFEVANSNKLDFNTSSDLLVEQLKANNTTISEIIEHVEDSITRITVIRRLAASLVLFGGNKPEKEIFETLTSTNRLLQEYPFRKVNIEKFTAYLNEVNNFGAALELAYYYNPSDKIDELRTQNAKQSAAVANYILEVQPAAFKEINKFNLALENAINHKAITQDEINNHLLTLSPFENKKRSSWVLSKFAQDQLAGRGSLSYGFKFNGLFQELAYLYAASGNEVKAQQCVDTLVKYSQNYFQNDYVSMADNATNVTGLFYLYNHVQPLNFFVSEYCRRNKIGEVEFYERLIARSNTGFEAAFNVNENGEIDNLNLLFGNLNQLEFFFKQLREHIQKNMASEDERNFYFALSYKDEGILLAKAFELRHQESKMDSIKQLFDRALNYYKQVESEFLAKPIEVKGAGMELTGIRSFLFLYPDMHVNFMPFEPRSIYFPYNSGVFIKFILMNNRFNELYSNVELPYISEWLKNLYINASARAFTIRPEVDIEVLTSLENRLSQRNASQYADVNYLYLQLAIYYNTKGKDEQLVNYFKKLDLSKIMNLVRNTGPFSGNFNNRSFTGIATAVAGLAKFGHLDESYKIINVFKNPINRSSLYAFAAIELLEQGSKQDVVSQLIDSAQIEITRIKNLSTQQPNRQFITQALVLRNSEQVPLAYQTVKNVGDKFNPTLRIVSSLAFNNDLFTAQQNIPGNISDSDQAQFLFNLLHGYYQKDYKVGTEWQQYDENHQFNSRNLIYVDDNN